MSQSTNLAGFADSEAMAAAAAFFGILGRLLQNEPTDESMAYLISEGLFEALPFAEDSTLAQRGQTEILAWLRDCGDVMDARCDYMRLHAGVGSDVRPWGSYYLTNEKLSFHADTLVIRDIYKQYGLEPVLKNHEPDDNIGFELEFISHLLSIGEEQAAKDFAKKHVKTWVRKWADAVDKAATTGYYRGLAFMAAGGIEAL